MKKGKSRPRWKLSKPVVQDGPLEAKGVSVSRCLPVFYQGVENGVDENEKHGTLTRAVSRAV